MTDHHNVTHNLSSCEVKARKEKKNQTQIILIINNKGLLAFQKWIGSSMLKKKHSYSPLITQKHGII